MQKKGRESRKASKWIALIAAALLVSQTVTGCGQSGNAGSSTSADAAEEETASAEASGNGAGAAAAGSTAEAAYEDFEIPENPRVREDGGVSIDVFAMDTYMTLLAYGEHAEEAVLAGAEEIHRLDDMLSTGNPDSEISKLNAAGSGVITETTEGLIARSRELYTMTEGLFNIAIYPVMKLWGFPTQEYRVPEKEEIEAALQTADLSTLTVSRSTADPENAAGSAETGETAAPASAETGRAGASKEAEKAAGTDAAAPAAASAGSAGTAAAAEAGETAGISEAAAAGMTAAPAAAANSENPESAGTEAAAGTGETAGSNGANAADTAAAPASEDAADTAETDVNSVVYEAVLGTPGMEIDLGGIAKGYTSSRIMEIFRSYGIEHGLVSLGGNVQAIGGKEGGDPWRVAIQNPEGNLDYLGVLEIRDRAVITSGGYERYFEQDGVRYHHIIDPRTGYPADSGLISATIVCEDGALADGLSTSLFIMGKEKAEEFWRSSSVSFDYILEDTEGKLYVTEGIADILTTEMDHEIIRK